MQEAASTFVASLSAGGEATTGTDLLNNLHLPASLQGEGQVLPADEAKDFSDISDFSDEEATPYTSTPAVTTPPQQPNPASHDEPLPTASAATTEPTQRQETADASLISLEEYLALADEQATAEAQPGSAPPPATAELLPSAEQPPPATFELLPSGESLAKHPPLLHSAGLVSVEQDEIAEAIMRETYGIRVPAADQGRVVVDIVSFSESLVPREWFPRPRLAVLEAPDRHALVCSSPAPFEVA
jgi:hypothetical protein